MKTPVAKKIPHKTSFHNKEIYDNYFWLRDPNWPQVENQDILDYLHEENKYYKAYEDKKFEDLIFKELKGRIRENDESYPVKKGEYLYFSRLYAEKDYPVYFRKKSKNEELVLDCNHLSRGKSSFAVGDIAVSEDHSKLAYSYDCDGAERYIIEVKDLSNSDILNDRLVNTIDSIIWNSESTGFFYVMVDEHWRRNKVYFHLLGTKQEADRLIYQEEDQIFSLSISASAAHEYLLINTGCSTSNEILYCSLSGEEFALQVAIKRRADHLYELDYLKNNFYLLTNDKGENFRFVRIRHEDSFEEENFKEIIMHSEDYYLVDFNLYNGGIIVTKKVFGINYFEMYSIRSYVFLYNIDLNEEIYEANVIYTNAEDEFCRISFSSLTTPKSVLEFHLKDKELHLRKIDDIPSGHEPEDYKAERVWVETIDGAKVPVSLVYKKDLKKEFMPIVLYGYGSYGLSMPINFRPNILSLLNRGVAYAIAHIRGGDELGFNWYKSAKFLNKKRSFEDFIAVAEFLIEKKYTSKEKLSIMGGSAGGMLMGAVINMRPELFRSVVALVPFVDVLNTMLDETLPLTPGEFEEWGNPIESEEYFDYIRSYSPYDNVKPKNYPLMLVTAGLTDPRVGYWEAAKWVAKLREIKLDKNLLLLKTEMESGHKGQSGRYKSLEEVAMIYSFILRTFNITS